MFGIKSSTRLALTIGIVGATLLWLAADLKVIPHPSEAALDARVTIAKLLAVDASLAVERNRMRDFRVQATTLVGADDDLHSIALVKKRRVVVASSETHVTDWLDEAKFPNNSRVAVSVFSNKNRWGELQILFNPDNKVSTWQFPLLMVLFLFSSLSVTTWFILNQTFRYLNPSKVVPNRVRSALDTLTEGLVLIDPSGEVVHSNTAFAEMVNGEPDDLVGGHLEKFPWAQEDDVEPQTVLPWNRCLEIKKPVRGVILGLNSTTPHRKYIVNSSPVFSGGEAVKGALISFEDVTDLERKKNELAESIYTLRKSRDEVARQNEELNFLANYDPLTKCYNRRSFWNQYNEMWSQCEVGQLSLIMVDIDHFKSINDNYGHSTGDEVLKDNGELLRRITGERGSVCRYGGEEFVILLPNTSLDQAVAVAAEIHGEFQRVQLGGLSITASLGVSNTICGVMDMQHLLDQADQCLYAAKRSGRNRVVRFDQCDHELLDSEMHATPAEPADSIQHSTVTGLFASLAFKSPKTAEHCMRVADLCVAVGQKLVSKRQLYRLEICGLLHDIGKIGVPDNILHKPGELTEKEWKIMRKHEEYGDSIIRSAFESEEIANIVKLHKESFATQSILTNSVLQADSVPIESRIITACDAFDSMIGERDYRPAQPIEVAIAELRRCTPDQFDAVVVEHLIHHVTQPNFLKSRNVMVKTSQESAVAIAKHLEQLHGAVANEDVNELKKVVEDIKADSASRGVAMLSDATDRLQEAITKDDSKLAQVMEVAEEVMQMCRSTRTSFVNPRDASESQSQS